jgi:flavin-dependent dehydrogenase
VTPQASRTEVFVVGGGPAGLAAAIAAARKGFRVVVADPALPPIDKACGEGLMPDAVTALESLGVNLICEEAVPFRGIRFCSADNTKSVQAEFVGRSGIGIRRRALHACLVRRAADLGVSMLWGSRVSGFEDGEVICEGRRVACRWLIGADGENSRIRTSIASRPPLYERIRFGHRQHFRVKPWSDLVEVCWVRNGQIVVAPVGPEHVCIAITSRWPHLRPDDVLRQAPHLATQLSGSPVLAAGRGARAALRLLPFVHRGSVALVGDASGSVDPITGEGLGLAFQQAAALAEALAIGDLRLYQAAHDHISRLPRLMSRLILAMDSHPKFQARALRTLAVEPQIFAKLLNIHIRALAPSKFGVGNALRLGWRLLSESGAGV